MASLEFFLISGMILVGIVFFLISHTYILGESEEVKRLEVKAEADEITSIIYRVSKDPAQYLRYCQYIKLANITIENGKLKYEREGFYFVNLLPSSVADTKLVEVAQFCVLKEDSKISVLGAAPTCELDGICTPEECEVYCPDCSLADCCGVKGCNPQVGENCENCPNDCFCDQATVCCPSSQDANEIGCSQTFGLSKGEKCSCTSQCSSNMECNPTTEEFRNSGGYEKACCEAGKSWNGSECILPQVYVISFVPAFYQNLNTFSTRANFMKSFTEATLPFRENPTSLVILIDNKNCPMSSETDIANLIRCGNDLAKRNGYPGADLTGGIFGICVGGDGCGGIVGYTQPGSGWFVVGYDVCTLHGCPSEYDAVVAPHEIGHNFRLCEGYCYSGMSCYAQERNSFGGFCGTSRVEQKFPYNRSATSSKPCDGCGPGVCCLGRLLTNDTINPANGGRDIMGPGNAPLPRKFACDSYLAFKEVAIKVYNFNLPPVTDLDIQACYNHIDGDTYP